MQEGYRHNSASADGVALRSLPSSSCTSTHTYSYNAMIDNSADVSIPIDHDKRRWMYRSGVMPEIAGPLSPGHAKSSRPYQRRRR